MAITDDDLARQLDSVPLVDPPDIRGAVMARVRAGFSRPDDRLKPVLTFRPRRRFIVGLAWAAAAAIVIGVAIERVSVPRSQTSAVIAPLPIEGWPVVIHTGALTVRRSGNHFAVQSSVAGTLDWDRAKLSMTKVLPDSTVVLERRHGASGPAEIRLSVAGREAQRISIGVD